MGSGLIQTKQTNKQTNKHSFPRSSSHRQNTSSACYVPHCDSLRRHVCYPPLPAARYLPPRDDESATCHVRLYIWYVLCISLSDSRLGGLFSASLHASLEHKQRHSLLNTTTPPSSNVLHGRPNPPPSPVVDVPLMDDTLAAWMILLLHGEYCYPRTIADTCKSSLSLSLCVSMCLTLRISVGSHT